MGLSAKMLALRRILSAAVQDGPRAALVTVGAKRRGAKQKTREFSRLVRLVAKRKPSVVLEIGTMHGGTLWAWCRLAAKDSLLISVDLPGGDFGGGYEHSHAKKLRSYARGRQRLDLLAGDSHDFGTLRRVQQVLGGRIVDLLFIDGDHTYEGVRRDFAMYGPLVGEGGLVAFHDVLPCRPEDGDVNRLWEQVKGDYTYEEMLDESDVSWRGPWGGIGVLFVS